MTRNLLAAVLTIVLMSSGCTLITASEPLGQPMLTDMQGTWHLKFSDGYNVDNVYYLSLMPDGSLAAVTVRPGMEAEAPFEIDFFEVVFSAHKGALYLNARDPDNESTLEPTQYFFHRALIAPNDPETLILFMPRIDVFGDAITAGRFAAETTTDEFVSHLNIIDGKALADFVDPDRFAEQFDVARPGVMRRLSDFGQTPSKDPAILVEAKQAHMACLLEEIGEDLKISRQLSARREVLALKQSAGFSASEIAEEIHRLESESAVERNPVYVDRQSNIIEAVDLLESQFVDYQACMVGRGYTLVDDPARLPFRSEDGMLIHLVSGDVTLSDGEKPMWIVKNGFGLFIFHVTIKAENTTPAGEPK
jgi:hypothetical protein